MKELTFKRPENFRSLAKSGTETGKMYTFSRPAAYISNLKCNRQFHQIKQIENEQMNLQTGKVSILGFQVEKTKTICSKSFT